MTKIILFSLFCFLTVVYGFTCFGRLFRNQRVSNAQTMLMGIGITGLIVTILYL